MAKTSIFETCRIDDPKKVEEFARALNDAYEHPYSIQMQRRKNYRKD